MLLSAGPWERQGILYRTPGKAREAAAKPRKIRASLSLSLSLYLSLSIYIYIYLNL